MTNEKRIAGSGYDITRNLMDIEPENVIFNIHGKRIAEYLMQWFERKGIDADIRVIVSDRADTGYNNNPDRVKPIRAYALVDMRNAHVRSNALNVAPQFQEKINANATMTFDKEFTESMAVFAYNAEKDPDKPFRFLTSKIDGRVAIGLDIFKILKFLLHAGNQYKLTIVETKTLRDGKTEDAFMKVSKKKKTKRTRDNSDDARINDKLRNMRFR